VNPLVYMSEGFRFALPTPGIGHMPVVAIYGGLLGAIAILGGLGVRGFVKRVQT
jgi:hypothetical protein